MKDKSAEKFNIIYFANMRFPSERAHSIQVVEMCQALQEVGHKVTLVVPKNKVNNTTEINHDYFIKQNFSIKRIGWPFSFFTIQVGSYLHTIIFSFLATFFAIFHRHDIVYVKDEDIVYPLSFLSNKIVWEPHVGDLDFSGKKLSRKALAIVALTQGVKNAFVKAGVQEEKIMVAHDAVRLDMFDIKDDNNKIRKELGLPLDKKIVMYTGHLFDWKGVHVLADAMSFCPKDTLAVFVGGLPQDVKNFSEKYASNKNIMVSGNKTREEIPKYLSAADILVLPNSAKTEISRTYTSPLKLFEYMASKRTVVASRLPSLCEVLNDNNAFLVDPDNPKLLGEAINDIAINSRVVNSKVDNAFNLVCKETWYNRAEKITNFFTNRYYGRT